MQHSPYTPGRVATEIPGRDAQLTDLTGVLARVATEQHFAGRIRVDVGPRGVGKTSLLRRAQHTAEKLGLATVFVTAGNGVLTAVLNDQITDQAKSWGGGDALRERLQEAKIAFGAPGFLNVELTAGRSVPPEATRAFRELVINFARESLEHDHAGVAIFIDELQSADVASLRTIAYAWQELQSEPRSVPAAMLAAGLSHTADVITDAVTHAERFQYRPLRDLDPADSREALSRPATAKGVSWQTPALQAVVERSQGYPYFLQLYGDEIWRAAGNPDPGASLTIEHVNQAQQDVDIDLTELYRTRWAKATPKERDILTAMAQSGQRLVARRDIATTLSTETTALSMPRQSLLDKGIVDAPEHGKLAFTVPGFGEYVLNQNEG